jgi:hypothetical protein
MSININLVSDKPNFKNFFAEGITLPERAELVMTKANLEIPVVKVVATTIPLVSALNYNDICLQVNIDGVMVDLTWQDLYDGYASLNAIDIDNQVTIGNFYGGQYELFPNHRFEMTDPAVGSTRYTKISFNKILAKTLDLKYIFYKIEAEEENRATDQQQNVEWYGAQGVITTNRGSGSTFMASNVMKELQLVATYSPQKQVNTTPTAFVFDGADISNFTGSGTSNLTSTATGINQAWQNKQDTDGLDLNGGWWQTSFTYGGTGKAVYGISLEGVGHGADKYTPIAGAYEPEIFDVGFEFDLVGAVKCYRIIDGQNLNTTPVTPNFKPANAKMVFSDNDRFFIQIQRGNLYNGTNEFVINLYHGHNTHNLNSNFTKLIYTAKRTLNNPAISPNIGFMTEANAGHQFNNNAYIPRSTQTISQGSYKFSVEGGNYTGVFSLDPYLQESLDGALYGRDFWSAYGLFSFDLDGSGGTNEGRRFTSVEGKDQTLIFSRKTNFTSSNSTIVYYLGQVEINDIYNTTDANIGLELQQFNSKATDNLPQQLVVELENLPIKAFVGSYIKPAPPTGLNSITETSGGERRIIGTIPVPPYVDDAVSIPIQYEPFNILYRPINNSNPFVLNQIQTSIYYQDFDTNVKKSFSTINGHLTIELTCRQGAKDPLLNNNLRPV